MCNGVARCDATGNCASGTPLVCNDNNACTADSCDAVTGVVSHTPIALDDGNECTTDSCDVATGPAHTPIDTAVCRGKANFHDRALAGLGGNGRACSNTSATVT